MHNMNVLKHARNRGHILEILKADYPHPVDFMVMRRCLSLQGINLMENDLTGYIKYLSNDGYISFVKDMHGAILYIELTNKGMKLLDGYIDDKAIILG